MKAAIINLAMCLGAGLLWWVGNIQMGNVKAIEYLGWLSAYPWYVAWVVAILPSISQLFITEQWSIEEKELDPLSMIFAGFVAIVIDLGGPVLGFFVVSGLGFDLLTLAAAIVIAAFASILCQHVAWVRGKAFVAILFAPRPTPAKKVQKQPTRLVERIANVKHENGREKAHASPKKDE